MKKEKFWDIRGVGISGKFRPSKDREGLIDFAKSTGVDVEPVEVYIDMLETGDRVALKSGKNAAEQIEVEGIFERHSDYSGAVVDSEGNHIQTIRPYIKDPLSDHCVRYIGKSKKPSEVVKQAGLKSLAELAEMSGESAQTLNNWFKRSPRRFELVLKGAVLEKTAERVDASIGL